MNPTPSQFSNDEVERPVTPSLNAQTCRLIQAVHQGEPLVTRRSRVLGQLYLCEGCCCGRVDRGFPPLPKAWIKEQWKTAHLNDTIQLTFSGCLGPCDLANVAQVVSATGETLWYGGLSELWHYETIVAWAHHCRQTNQWHELPASLRPFHFIRFAPLAE